jgi:hypothetical protein
MTYLRGVGDWYQQNRQAVVCHESGHLIGMDHKAGGCMAYGYYDPYWNHSQPVWPDQQDKDDIQFTYPVVHGT